MRLSDLDVLIVDDHEAMRVMLTRVLVRAGVRSVRAAASGAEALLKMAEQAPHLVLADQRMPGMDGLAFIRAARAEETLRGVQIVMISGASGGEHKEAAHAAGADAVLVKPVSPRALLETIETVMK